MEAQTASWKDMFGGAPQSGDSSDDASTQSNPYAARRTRKPRTTGSTVPITKDAIKSAIEFANLPLALASFGQEISYELTPAEIEKLAEAWYRVCKQYPSVAKYIVQGEKLGIWGNLFYVHYKIIAPRFDHFLSNQGNAKRRTVRTAARPQPAPQTDNGHSAGGARTYSGAERDRQDDASGVSSPLA